MRGRRAELKAIDGGLSRLPKPPDHMPAEMLAEWTSVCADLKRRKLLTLSCLGVVASYITAVWTVSECRRALAADGWFVHTKTGEPKAHPAAGMLSKHQDIVARLGAELGLTPAARSRKGLQGPKDTPDDGAPPGMDL